MKMAIMGAGGIAVKMAATIARMDQVEAYAIASRDYERAEAFAEKYGFTKAYGSYREMLADDEIDLVYVATPHSHHYDCVKMCLEFNKNVLCEKAFTVNAEQAEEILKIAEEKKLLLTEAIWTRYMPSRIMISDLIDSGVVGKVTSLVANLGYPLGDVKRMVEPNLAGGALLDLGVYLLNFASMIFGEEVETITSAAVMTEKGVDQADSITMIFKNGEMAVMHCNMLAALDRRGTIFGEKGYIDLQNINNVEKITVYDENHQEVASYFPPKQITGFEYEVQACVDALEKGKTECPQMPHAETIRIMKMMDTLRQSWGYEIPMISIL